MASSEMSSSDIFQGQGFYNDGGNEAAGIPPLPAPLSPQQIPLEADEGLWKKYSAHYEFPLSLLIAVGIHLVAVLLVIAFMAIKIHWGQPKLPTEELIVLEGGRFNDPNAGNKPPHEGGGTGENGENGRDPFAAPFDVKELISPETNKPVDPDNTGILLDQSSRDLDKNKNQRLQGKPKQGTGVGNGSGPGFGDGPGVGVNMGRNKRWNILLSYDEPETLLGQLANLRCIMAGRVNSGRFLFFKDLAGSKPGSFEEMTPDAFAKWVNASKKLWFTSSDRTTNDNFAFAVNQSERMLMLVMVIPLEMEKAILAAELKHHKMTEGEVRTHKFRTSFRVVRQGETYRVEVVKSVVMEQ